MNYEQMSDFEINKAVAEALGAEIVNYVDDSNAICIEFDGRLPVDVDYCNCPADAWPVIVENEIGIEPNYLLDGSWMALKQINDCEHFLYADKNPLRAAMIVFLMMQESDQ